MNRSIIHESSTDQSSMNPFETSTWRLQCKNMSGVMLLVIMYFKHLHDNRERVQREMIQSMAGCIIPVDVARPANPVSLTPPTSLSPVGWSYRYLFPEPTLLTDHTTNGTANGSCMAKIKKSMINAWEIDQSSMNPFETTAWRLKVNNKSSVMLLA